MIKTNGLMHPRKNNGDTTFYVDVGKKTVQVNIKREHSFLNLIYINGHYAFDSVSGESDISIRNRVKEFVLNQR